MKGTSKYGEKGNCTKDLFGELNIPEETKENLAKWGNFGLAQGTWSSYRTAERMLLTCLKQKKRAFELPLTMEIVVIFIDWLLEERKVKAGTVSNYLAGIRQMHVSKGIEPPIIRSAGVNWVLKGKKNAENIIKRRDGEVGRLPMTLTMMKLLKETIRAWETNISEKLLIWAVCTLAFNGAFRVHEILSKNETFFDEDFTLLVGDIKIRQGKENQGGRFLEVKLKSPKEDKAGKAVVVEVFESKGPTCPVKAFERWSTRETLEVGFPLFRERNGTLLTGRKLNKLLKTLLGPYIDYKKGKFTSHSFRIGLATTLGSIGVSEADIKAAGRWNSNAYEIYMKLPRVKRSAVAKRIGQLYMRRRPDYSGTKMTNKLRSDIVCKET